MKVLCCVFFFATLFIVTQQQEIDIRSINNVIKTILRNENPLIATMRAGALLKNVFNSPVGGILADIEEAKKSVSSLLSITKDDESINTLLRAILGLQTKSKETPSPVPASVEAADLTVMTQQS